ncbi:Mrp/NBP35 family ATP-binding protein [Pararhodospirillum oryzae]|uniref:Iron-sulfur cluster carrier protein n=1 Tax=Pararhodospirillum oryzae TaxID=478448 RepID=A0A512H948_9PROT|nr:Mrp/NBP35 family ATP-binding protein [Pararhodospirillum oryzae]GEO81979.1 iron-sulfur cluster carrier protein [Pararhodospirillum oryzae]
MTDVTRADLLAALAQVRPDGPSGPDVVSLGWVEGLAQRPGAHGVEVSVALAVPAERARALEPVCATAEAALRAVPGVGRASVVLTAERPAPAPTRAAPARLSLPGLKRVIAVASGKGGVGKSTTTVNLAIALARRGLRVAVLDADVYGPSLPRLLGVAGTRPANAGGRLLPVPAHGLSVMSIGFLVPEEDPVIWRGPMVAGALEQLLRDVDWGEQDVMLLDMPPGTGDAQLTVCQKVALDGAIIVSTPQDIALLDARKGLAMFRKVDVPILGIVENMSYFLCPHCGERTDIFSHGGARRTAEELGAPFLGALPLDVQVREAADAGQPLALAHPDSPQAQAYDSLAAQVWTLLEKNPAPER